MYLIQYDISANRLRSKLAQRLISHGYVRIQYSIFAGPVHPNTHPDLWLFMASLPAAEPKLKVYIVSVTKASFLNMIVLGQDEIDRQYIVGDRRCLII